MLHIDNVTPPLLYADADSGLEEADYVILGVSFEKTVSHRKGTAEAPRSIREESYNFETFHYRHDIDIGDIGIYDMGALEADDFPELETKLRMSIAEIMQHGAFPVVLGGEHSITPFVVKEIKRDLDRKSEPELKVVSVDAHIDFRNEYLGERNSHACSTRRISEIVGINNVLTVGVRSFEKEEYYEAKESGLKWIDSFYARRKGIEQVLGEIHEFVGDSPTYLTVDMDGIDPAFAPGVGTPEPFGLSSWDVSGIIEMLADRIIGMDVVEISPPFDNGNTSALACRLIGEMMASRETSGSVKQADHQK